MRKFILFCTFIFVSQFSNAVIEGEKIYIDLTDHFGNTISFYDSKDDNSSFQVYQSHANERELIFEAPFLAQKPNINTAFLYKIEGRGDYAIISMNIQPNYIQSEKKYLIKGDIFTIKNISSNWIEIEYKNPETKKSLSDGYNARIHLFVDRNLI
ncbi:hypothetical protein RO21_05280 [[Actinobacillus] muris]|uniref:Uncharacterized protein n=1 Tax=Muribacter muris TaxID=67855 RepID=A0A0J5S484_9PAST|nr:hypothetical protein [Muribacter muris]KMK51597.1 hypothetical protein RO21_05280 [[Actinobacillus] muris] [Muribacter muris]